MTNRHLLQIKPDGTLTAIITDEQHVDYQTLSAAVGGYIEQVRPTTDTGLNLVLWCNEEGKLQGLEENPIATRLAKGAIYDWDTISGDAVLTIADGPDVRGLTLREIMAVSAEFDLVDHPTTSMTERHKRRNTVAQDPQHRDPLIWF